MILAGQRATFAQTMILRIQPDADVKPVAEKLDADRAQEQQLADIDFAFGCWATCDPRPPSPPRMQRGRA